MQPAFVSAAKIAATLTPALRATDGVITITGIGDHLRPEWPITITGMRTRSSVVPSATAEIAPTKRDRHLQLIAERGRMGWQRASGYNWRALVEADIGRYKRVIGDALRSRTGGRQMTEVAIAAASLNRMLELGRPEYVRLT